ncbi:MAG: amidohydrolase [Bacteroidetes bacterium]|nr:amidohydrolase [Bacteroidota bacterium]
MISEIIKLRHELHQHPEVSNNELSTSERMVNFIKPLLPDEIITLGKTGKAFVFNGIEAGKTTVFRAELDALPIQEKSTLPYASVNQGVAHVCGHDGHMAVLAGLARKIAEHTPRFGKTVLLFQPAEEVEQGAREVVENPLFQALKPDFIFALHNIPGVEKHHIVVKEGSFSAASKGMTIQLFGKTSHAAEPEKGISPANAIAHIIKRLNSLPQTDHLFSDLTLLTIIYIRMGEISFGTSPGYAEIGVTLRAFENIDMEGLTARCEQLIKEVSEAEKLNYYISYSEEFPASVNDAACLKYVTDSAIDHNLHVRQLNKPFTWSEDFGYYSQQYPSCLFGLGSGITQPSLHNPDYDFPDDIISTGINMFYAIYKKINLQDDQ